MIPSLKSIRRHYLNVFVHTLAAANSIHSACDWYFLELTSKSIWILIWILFITYKSYASWYFYICFSIENLLRDQIIIKIDKFYHLIPCILKIVLLPNVEYFTDSSSIFEILSESSYAGMMNFFASQMKTMSTNISNNKHIHTLK